MQRGLSNRQIAQSRYGAPSTVIPATSIVQICKLGASLRKEAVEEACTRAHLTFRQSRRFPWGKHVGGGCRSACRKLPSGPTVDKDVAGHPLLGSHTTPEIGVADRRIRGRQLMLPG